MKKDEIVVMLGTPHRLREPGKESPDGRLKECVYGREIVACVKQKLEDCGVHVMVDYEPLNLPKSLQCPGVKTERQRELTLRVNTVNSVCRSEGTKRVVYVSIHVNAAGSDGKWHSANGWQVCVGSKSSKESKLLANCLFDAAAKHGLKMRKPTATQKYWPQSLYVLNNTLCPAVLTENLFQDNIDDVDLLLSDEGRHIIESLHVEGILKYIESL